MQKLSNMISMEQEPVDSEGGDMPKISRPLYPYGLSFCLENSELEKLDVDIEDWAVGDIFPLDIFAKLTSLSQNESTDGKRIRAEFQIIAIGSENEESEDDYESDEPKFRPLG